MALITVFCFLFAVIGLGCTHPLSSSKSGADADLLVPVPLKTTCPDGGYCSDESTCCPVVGDDKYGCCPHTSAVCCPDKKHCCPSGYSCQDSSEKCFRADSSHPLLQLVSQQPEVRNIKCPNGEQECPDGNTCCKNGDSTYACCPKTNAVCCGDMKHCCPFGYACEGTKCVDADSSHPLLQLASRPVDFKVLDIICPDNRMKCPNGNTCCSTGPYTYGCCPTSNGVCCNDDYHCCAPGHKCAAKGKCESMSGDYQPLTLISKTDEDNQVCPDHKAQCKTGETCCLNKENKFGCCPDAKAVCCSDRVHCCPEGFKCGTDTCSRSDSSHPLLELASLPVQDEVKNVLCPDEKEECPDKNTCCLTATGKYGCCPKVDAVCCPDMKHCCPKGYNCQDSTGKCLQDDSFHPMLDLVIKGEEEQPTVLNVICPDGKSQCPDKETCCKSGKSSYGCCPKEHAVCCKDMKHCCPEGYTCETSTGHCEKADSSHPLIALSARSEVADHPPPEPHPVACADHKHVCPVNSSCCYQSKTKKYGCCDQPHSVCCLNGTICCPTGYTCDEKHRVCKPPKGGAVPVPFLLATTPKLPVPVATIPTNPKLRPELL